MHQLLDFSLGHVFGDLGNHPDNPRSAGFGGNGQRPRQQKISHQYYGGRIPERVCHGPAASHGGTVHQIVVQQCGRMQILKDGGELVGGVAIVTAQPCRYDHQQGPEPFPAAE